MSEWSYVRGTITVEPLGRSQEEKRYILDTVLKNLPVVSGSEEDMQVYVIQKNGHSTSSSHDEFGRRTDKLIDFYGGRNARSGMMEMQDKYILVVDGALRDKNFSETFSEFVKWLVRLAKRVWVREILVEINDYYNSTIIRDEKGVYSTLFEDPSWFRGMDKKPALVKKINNLYEQKPELKDRKRKLYEKNPELEKLENPRRLPNWCEFMMWEQMDGYMYPRVLGYKYFADDENDRKVQDWLSH